MTRRIGSFLAVCLAALCVVAWLTRSHEAAPASAAGMHSGTVGTFRGHREAAPEQVGGPPPLSDALAPRAVDGRGLSLEQDADRPGVRDGDPNKSDRVEAQLFGFFSRQPNLGITSIDVRCSQTDCPIRLAGLKPRMASQLLRTTMGDDLLHAFMENEDLSLDAEVTKVSGDTWELRFRFLTARP